MKNTDVAESDPEERTPVARDQVASTVELSDVFTSYVIGPVPVEGFQEKSHPFADIEVLFGRRFVGTVGVTTLLIVNEGIARILLATLLESVTVTVQFAYVPRARVLSVIILLPTTAEVVGLEQDPP